MSQFLYSGMNKISKFEKKVSTLEKKTNYNFPTWLCEMGMVGVIILEIIGSLILIYTVCCLNNKSNKKLLKNLSIFVIILFVLFIIVATIIYHPPGEDKMIPFMSNVSTIGGFGFLLYIFLQ
tara:strand:+ start:692 stop:1057 length:366 start_codon:yes stop_codon:yes gene_type:complete